MNMDWAIIPALTVLVLIFVSSYIMYPPMFYCLIISLLVIFSYGFLISSIETNKQKKEEEKRLQLLDKGVTVSTSQVKD